MTESDELGTAEVEPIEGSGVASGGEDGKRGQAADASVHPAAEGVERMGALGEMPETKDAEPRTEEGVEPAEPDGQVIDQGGEGAGEAGDVEKALPAGDELYRSLLDEVLKKVQVAQEQATTERELEDAREAREQANQRVSQLESKANDGKTRRLAARIQERSAYVGGLLALAVGLAALTGVVLAYGGELDIVRHTRWVIAVCSGILSWLFLVGAFSIPTLNDARKEQRAIEAEAREDVADSANDLTNSKDLVALIQANRRQMSAYDVLAQAQAKTAFRNSQFAMAAGLLVLVAGAVVAIAAPEVSTKIATASLTAIGGALSGYIAKTFLESYSNAVTQLNFYFQQPLITSYLLTAQRLIDELTADKRDAALDETIARINDTLVRPWNVSGSDAKAAKAKRVSKAKPISRAAGTAK